MGSGARIRVINPGMQTTIQDLGRSGYSDIGVVRGGAADTLSLRAGNRLLENVDGAAAVEMTLVGGTFEFEHDVRIVLSGGAAAGRIEGPRGPVQVEPWSPVDVQAGERLVTGAIRGGVRTYLCVTGGVAVPSVLGSRSTHLSGGFGGMDGRPLRAGDLIETEASVRRTSYTRDALTIRRIRDFCVSILTRRTIRAVDGVHAEFFSDEFARKFWESEFDVSIQSNRTGLRLTGGALGASCLDGRMPSEGMMLGAVQAPMSGELIVLMVDHPTTGGYPVIACIAAVDHAVLGQIAPREAIRFERVTRDDARRLFAEQERRLDEEIPPA